VVLLNSTLNNPNLVMKMLVRSKPRRYSENSSLDCSFGMNIKLRNNSTNDYVRTQEEKPTTIKMAQETQ
jgi:hypothetical protein